MENAVDTFETYRPLLFYTAYRMLGTAMEAEDMVQETFLRYMAAGPENIDHPKAFLTKVITRLCLDHIKSARVQREQYIGPWLPEPVMTDNLPPQIVSQKETLSMAFLLLLQALSPLERAVFLLREVFAYGYEEISEIVNKSEANCRQLFSRARKYITANRPRYETDSAVQNQVVSQYVTALYEGDSEQLLQLMAPNINFVSDGGGKVTAARHPLVGREAVLRFVQGLFRLRPENTRLEIHETNATTSLFIWEGDILIVVMNFEIFAGKIQQVRSVLNPDKLSIAARFA